ncbi:MAG: hypothetical protein HQL97_06485 [Magnetococcales bacterium]|nr:hypothetical protein [Magnetococcales bacterium]
MIFRLLFPRIEVSGANALAGQGAMGYPALTAFLGFSQVVARAVAGQTEGRFLHRFAVVHHTGRARFFGISCDKPTKARYVWFDKEVPGKAREKYWFTPPEEIHPQVDLTFSLLLETDLPAERVARLRDDPAPLARCLGHRALGGVIHRAGEKVMIEPTDALELLARSGRGHLLVDRTPELFPNDGRDALDVLLDKLTQPEEPDTPESLAGDRLFMTHIGYLAISPPAVRTRARGEIPHQHAEPIHGLAAFRRTHAVNKQTPMFWKPIFNPTQQTYTLKGEQP